MKLSASRVASRWVAASRIDAPPKMVEAITEWVQRVLAGEALAQVEEARPKVERQLKEIEDGTSSMTRGPYAVDPETARSLLLEKLDEMDRVERKARRFRPLTSSGSKDYFQLRVPLDLSGWRYRSLVEDGLARRREQDPGSLWLFDKMMDPVRAVLYRDLRVKGRPMAGATWQTGQLTFWGIPTYLHREREFDQWVKGTAPKIVRHELQHMAQEMLREATQVETAGLPSGGRPGWDDDPSMELGTAHALRDIEFYPRLQDDIDAFKAEAGEVRDLNRAVKVWTGALPEGRVDGVSVSPSEFFLALKKHDRRKWQKAVGEFWQEVRSNERVASMKTATRCGRERTSARTAARKALWHITKDRNFRPDPDYRPVSGGGWDRARKPMLYATTSPFYWHGVSGGGAGPWTEGRAWAAELEVLPGHPPLKRENPLRPQTILDPAFVRVKRVIPVEHAIAEETGYLGNEYVGGDYVYGKTAARPIRLPTREIKTLAKKLAQRLSQWGLPKPGRVIAQEYLPLTNVKGDEVVVEVLLTGTPGRNRDPFNQELLNGGFLKRRPEGPLMRVFVNPHLDRRSFEMRPRRMVEDELYRLLAHELTHAADIWSGKGSVGDLSKDMGDLKRHHHNHPAEVRALMRDVVTHVEPTVQEYMDIGMPFNLAVREALKDSKWPDIEPYLEPRNKKTILKGVYTHLQDLGLDEGRTASASRVASVSYWHVTDLDSARKIVRSGVLKAHGGAGAFAFVKGGKFPIEEAAEIAVDFVVVRLGGAVGDLAVVEFQTDAPGLPHYQGNARKWREDVLLTNPKIVLREPMTETLRRSGHPMYKAGETERTASASRVASRYADAISPTETGTQSQPWSRGRPLFLFADSKMERKVMSAWRMLPPRDQAFVAKYVQSVQFAYKARGQRSGYNRSDRSITLAAPTLKASRAWIASVLVHEAVHGEQGASYHGKETESEQEALARQLETLIAVGGAPHEIAHLESQQGTHWQDAFSGKRRWASRQKGKSLPETGYDLRTVTIYRGVRATESEFKSMDYVTRNRRWAQGHADHVAAVEGEPAVVLKARVPAAQVFEAYNPGEYFYDGPTVKGRVVYRQDYS